MNVKLRRKAVCLAVTGIVAAASIALATTAHHSVAVTAAAVATPGSSATLDPPPVPVADHGPALIGADPDPAAFDPNALEWWWLNYQHTHR